MNNINESYFNYLMVIDNEGMNIYYDTISEIRKIHDYGDIIINFQDAEIARNLKNSPSKVRKFFGKTIPMNTKRAELCDIYIEQLNKIGLGKIEKLKVATETGYYYTLLFCCRYGVSGDWLKLIKFYSDKRFKNFTDKDFKQMWDIKSGKQLNIDRIWK